MSKIHFNLAEKLVSRNFNVLLRNLLFQLHLVKLEAEPKLGKRLGLCTEEFVSSLFLPVVGSCKRGAFWGTIFESSDIFINGSVGRLSVNEYRIDLFFS